MLKQKRERETFYLPSQSTSSIHLLHPEQVLLHIRHPVAQILQTPCIEFKTQDHDLTQHLQQHHISLQHLVCGGISVAISVAISRTITFVGIALFVFMLYNIQ